MESKHFSHQHPLLFHQVPQGSQTHCSGCKSPASGNVYVCWQCNYFLHDQCFRAQRSLNHPSHPLHPLTLVPFPTYPSSSFFCNSCSLAGDAFSYSCSACEFDIHLHCALTPNPNPHLSQNYHNHQNPIYPIHTQIYPPPPPPQSQPTGYPPAPNNPFPDPNQHYPPTAYPQPNPTPQNYVPPPSPPPLPSPTAPICSTVVNATPSAAANPPQPSNPQSKPPSIIKHFSHPHVLKQMEIEKKNAKVCSACECELSGSAYCCTESYCSFNLHKSCFDSPREVKHKSHLQHPLTLLATPPYSDGFTCNACLKDGKAFAYNCAACSYDLHIDCIQWPDTVNRPDHNHNLTLYYSSPVAVDQASEEATFMCDVCKNPVHEMAWLYYCRECDFGTHLECVASGIQQQNENAAKSEEELLREVELKFAVLQLLLGAQGRKAALQLI
ncbi:hypothetical protein C2S51_011335 [Perilla frutescens var. frutescens]|nr:hypothetical protein C2S51_011335 [Perilla frutescens var. frutescens]